jgi:hypothetical protein
MIVVDSGNRLIGSWIEKQRNVAEDYQRAFGRPAPRIIGIAVMTDTDNSANHAESYYGDIFFSSVP